MAGKVNLQAQFARFDDYWSPKIVASVNDYDVKLVKVQDEFVWHQHDETDEVFLVMAGQQPDPPACFEPAPPMRRGCLVAA